MIATNDTDAKRVIAFKQRHVEMWRIHRAALRLELWSRGRCEALLAATIESPVEGMIATEATDAKRVIALHQRFVEMWRIDSAALRSFEAVRSHIAARTRRGSLACTATGD